MQQDQDCNPGWATGTEVSGVWTPVVSWGGAAGVFGAALSQKGLPAPPLLSAAPLFTLIKGHTSSVKQLLLPHFRYGGGERGREEIQPPRGKRQEARGKPLPSLSLFKELVNPCPSLSQLCWFGLCDCENWLLQKP